MRVCVWCVRARVRDAPCRVHSCGAIPLPMNDMICKYGFLALPVPEEAGKASYCIDVYTQIDKYIEFLFSDLM